MREVVSRSRVNVGESDIVSVGSGESGLGGERKTLWMSSERQDVN